MLVLDIALPVAVVALLVAPWFPPRVRRRASVGAGALLVAAAAATVLVEGARWQRAPLLAAVVVGAAVAVVRTPHPARTPRRVLPALGTAAAGGLVLAGLAAAWAFPVLRLPSPTGPEAVGTTVLEWSDDRPEPGTAAPDDRRTLVAQVWYPARPDADAERALYLGRDAVEARAVADGLGAHFGVPSLLLSEAAVGRGTAVPDAPAADVGPCPVVLFSPGLGGVRTQGTALAEELASHGYVVVALDHPYDSAAVVLGDGSVATSQVAATGDHEQDALLSAGWTATRAADLRSALDHLGEVGTGGGPLAGLLDLERVAATGHSLGGRAAVLAAREDERVDAVVAIDGFPGDDGVLDLPVLALVAGVGVGSDDGDHAYAAALDALLAPSDAPGYRLTVDGAAHLSFTDAELYLPQLPALLGTPDRTTGPRTTARATLAFLDAQLRDGPDPAAVLDGLGALETRR